MFRSALSKVTALALIVLVVGGVSVILIELNPFRATTPIDQTNNAKGNNTIGNQPPQSTQTPSTNNDKIQSMRLVGTWNLVSSALYYDGGGGGTSPLPANNLQINSDGTWSYGATQGTWTVENITSEDWMDWVTSPQSSIIHKIVLNNWDVNGTRGTVTGPIQYSSTSGKIDFVWVVVPVDPPLTPYPGEIYLKFSNSNTNG